MWIDICVPKELGKSMGRNQKSLGGDTRWWGNGFLSGWFAKFSFSAVISAVPSPIGDTLQCTSKSFKCTYPGELELKLEHNGTHATFLDLHIKVKDGIFVYKLW